MFKEEKEKDCKRDRKCNREERERGKNKITKKFTVKVNKINRNNEREKERDI